MNRSQALAKTGKALVGQAEARLEMIQDVIADAAAAGRHCVVVGGTPRGAVDVVMSRLTALGFKVGVCPRPGMGLIGAGYTLTIKWGPRTTVEQVL